MPTEPAVSGLIPDVTQQFFLPRRSSISAALLVLGVFSRLSIHLLSVQLAKSAHNLLFPSSLFFLNFVGKLYRVGLSLFYLSICLSVSHNLI